MALLLEIILSILLACITHESGHLLMAIRYGKFLDFSFDLGRYYIPRYVWQMPGSLTIEQKRNVALAGFRLELLAAIILYLPLPIYSIVAIVHLLAYPFYSGDSNDFRFI